MNLVYGGLALIISFVIAKYFSTYSAPKWKMFAYAALSVFLSISILGGVFYALELGFFSHSMTLKEVMLRVFGLAGFLGFLVGMKTVNTALLHAPSDDS